MRKPLRALLVVLPLAIPMAVTAQQYQLHEATYITKEQVDSVNTLPGTDRQIISRDIGELNLAVGIIHRGALNAAPAGGGGRAGGGRAGGAAAPDDNSCGVTSGAESGARGILHEFQTETYVIWSGEGTLVTGGGILNGRRVAPTVNGPSCSGAIVGDFKAIHVKEGDVVIIPAGTPHGWSSIPDHVDYLSIRPDPDRVIDDFISPQVTLR